MTRILISLFLVLLTACTPRGTVTLDPAAARVGQVEKIFIGTTRQQEQDGSFGSHRSEQVRFARYDISVPPERKLGEINWPPRHGTANPKRHFLTTDQIVYQNDTLFQKFFQKFLMSLLQFYLLVTLLLTLLFPFVLF